MLKPEFVKKVKEALGLSSEKVAAETVDKLADLVADLVKSGEEVPFGRAGKFVCSERSARSCRNPQTGEMIDVPAKKTVKFKPSMATRKAMNE